MKQDADQTGLPLSPSRRRLAGGLAGFISLAAVGACASRRGRPPSLPTLASVSGNSARLRWSEWIGRGGYGFVPAVYDGRLWAGSSNGRLLGLDGQGKRVASLDSGVEFSSGVGADGKVLVMTGAEGRLYGLEADGTQRWVVEMGAEAASVPAVGSGMAIVRLTNSTVAAYDLADGSVRWLYTRRNPTLVLRQTSEIAIDPTLAYVGLPGGRMVALSLTNGASRWESGISLPRGSNEIERIADVVARPVFAGASICAAAYQGRVTCLNRETGRAVWSQNLNVGSGADVDSSRMVISDVNSKLYAFARDGKSLWESDALRGR
ncbi:MAG: PQQ-binding-like beta-propeller repeat protein, partial [Burkholderiaceae bacterium]